MPNEKMSLRKSAGLPDACSGDMYATVPTTRPAAVWSVARARHRVCALLDLRKAEVGELGVAALRQQDVARLDVAMEDARLVGRGERIRNPHEQLDDLTPCPDPADRPLRQRAASRQLGDQVLATVEIAGVVDDEDMRMAEGGGRLGFALETLPGSGVCHVVREELHCHRPIEPGVERAIDHAHAALTEYRLQTVRADGRSGPHIHGRSAC